MDAQRSALEELHELPCAPEGSAGAVLRHVAKRFRFAQQDATLEATSLKGQADRFRCSCRASRLLAFGMRGGRG